MSFDIGTRYAGPPESSHDWFAEALGQVRRERVGRVPVRLHLIGGGHQDGDLDGVSELPSAGEGGMAIILEHAGSIACRDLEAFTLLPSGGPIDRSDELGQ